MYEIFKSIPIEGMLIPETTNVLVLSPDTMIESIPND